MGASLVYREEPDKNIEWESGEDAKAAFACGEMQGWRLNMEDAAICNQSFEPTKHIYGVFDGHGGGEVAKYTKRHYEDGLKEIEEYKAGNFEEGLRKSFLQVDASLRAGGLQEVAQIKIQNPPNKSVLMKALTAVSGKKKQAEAAATAGGDSAEKTTDDEGEDLQLDSIGCTANVVMVDYNQSKIFVANAGDSRAVMGRGGSAVPLSFDHKPENQTEIDRIYAAGSVVTEGRVDGHLNLTRAIGDLRFKVKEGLTAEQFPITANPDTYEYALDSECDFILMGCDGVWEQKSNDEMVEWVYQKLEEASDKSPASLQSIVQDLLHSQLSPNHIETGGLGCDNMTCILIVFKK